MCCVSFIDLCRAYSLCWHDRIALFTCVSYGAVEAVSARVAVACLHEVLSNSRRCSSIVLCAQQGESDAR
jgi:hypothetical protein